MPIANNNAQGSIVLSGDLTGFGENPELRATGVTPNAYNWAQFVVDAKGRLVFCKTPTEQKRQDLLISLIGNASYTTHGLAAISVSQGLEIDSNSVISSPYASEINSGIVKLSSEFSIDGNGYMQVNIEDATTTSFGLVKTGSGVSNNGSEISNSFWNAATSTSFGHISVAPYTISGLAVSYDGVNANLFGIAASPSTRGLVIPQTTPSNVYGFFYDVNGDYGVPGTINIHHAKFANFMGWLTPSDFHVNSGLSIDNNGFLNYDQHHLVGQPIASSTTSGVVKIGAGLHIDPSTGTLSDINLSPATTSTLGTIRLSIFGPFYRNGDFLESHLASDDVKGIFQSNNSFTDGFMNTTPASVSPSDTTGEQQSYTGLRFFRADNVAGPGSTPNHGVVKSVNSDEMITLNGELSFGPIIPRINSQNIFDKSQISALSQNGVSGTFTPDFSVSNVIQYTLSGAVQFNAPTNVIPGAVYQLIIKKNNNSDTVTLSSEYKLNKNLNTSFVTSQAARWQLICVSPTDIIVVQNDIYNL